MLGTVLCLKNNKRKNMRNSEPNKGHYSRACAAEEAGKTKLDLDSRDKTNCQQAISQWWRSLDSDSSFKTTAEI